MMCDTHSMPFLVMLQVFACNKMEYRRQCKNKRSKENINKFIL